MTLGKPSQPIGGKKNAIHLFNCQESFSLSTGNCLPLVLYIFLYKVVIP